MGRAKYDVDECQHLSEPCQYWRSNDEKSGTPLAAAAVGLPFDFSVSLFYLSSSNTLSEVSSVDEKLEVWTVGDASKEASIQPANSSQLAAVAHFCEYGCAQLT